MTEDVIKVGYVAVVEGPSKMIIMCSVQESVEAVKALWPKGTHPKWKIVPVFVRECDIPRSNRSECPMCNGRGVVSRTSFVNADSLIERSCAACKGKGVLDAG